jgi:hypothetical protein
MDFFEENDAYDVDRETARRINIACWDVFLIKSKLEEPKIIYINRATRGYIRCGLDFFSLSHPDIKLGLAEEIKNNRSKLNDLAYTLTNQTNILRSSLEQLKIFEECVDKSRGRYDENLKVETQSKDKFVAAMALDMLKRGEEYVKKVHDIIEENEIILREVNSLFFEIINNLQRLDEEEERNKTCLLVLSPSNLEARTTEMPIDPEKTLDLVK